MAGQVPGTPARKRVLRGGEGGKEGGCCLTTHGLVGSGKLRLSYSSFWSQECAEAMILMSGGNVHTVFSEGAVGGLAGGQEEVCAEDCHFPSLLVPGAHHRLL